MFSACRDQAGYVKSIFDIELVEMSRKEVSIVYKGEFKDGLASLASDEFRIEADDHWSIGTGFKVEGNEV